MVCSVLACVLVCSVLACVLTSVLSCVLTFVSFQCSVLWSCGRATWRRPLLCVSLSGDAA